MTVPLISPDDLAQLQFLTPDLDFTDAERQAVLLAAGTSDVNAAPGSGKTTLLAAKLLLLARRWPHHTRGICVLSHTNVAREEIQERLAATAVGVRLLAYPHFIGTIHGFVDRFLALPALRSLGLTVDVIDDEVFAKKAIALAMKKSPLWGWAQKDEGVKPMVGGLVYRGADLKLDSEDGTLPKTTAKTYPLLEEIKKQLTNEGVFRYADVFAFAEVLLARFPAVKAHVSHRFPLVYLDEMQDTSWEQEALLARLFDEAVAVQRYGDLNQRILVGEGDLSQLSFPREDSLSIGTSKRFGPAIAAAVSGVRVGGNAVIGTAADVHAPTLMTYTTERMGDVLNRFGQLVLDRFNDEQLHRQPIKALCARKQGNAKQTPGRTLLDYWPAYLEQSRGGGGRSERLWSLLSQPAETWVAGISMHSRAADAKRAIVLVLRAANSPHIKGLRDGAQLFRRLADAGQDVKRIRQLCRELAIAQNLGATEDGRAKAVELFTQYLQPLLSAGMSAAMFQAMSVFEAPEKQPEQEANQRVCRVTRDNRVVEVELGTVASMKGETHLATLVLESLGHPSRRFDLAEALPVLARLKLRDPKMSESVLAQFRSLYVGMSRPTSFLCLAVNRTRVSDDCVAALKELGWVVDALE
jgi:DNA helicase II / ATP-dependent DNA helicase PcrA